MKRAAGLAAAVMAAALMAAPTAEAGLWDGANDIFNGLLAVPRQALKGTVDGPLVFGTVAGAVQGLIDGTVSIVKGLFEITGLLGPSHPVSYDDRSRRGPFYG